MSAYILDHSSLFMVVKVQW